MSDPADIRASDGVGCTGCAAPCCSQYRVSLTAFDLQRLVESGTQGPEAWVVPYAVSPRERYAGFRLDRSDRLFELALAKADGLTRGAPCVFLRQGTGGGAGCAMYAARPLACRAFPVQLQAQQQVAFEDLPCLPERLDHQLLARAPSWRQAVIAMDLERVAHEAIAAEWNRELLLRPRSPVDVKELTEFLLARAARWEATIRCVQAPENRSGPRAISASHRAGVNPLVD